METPTGTIESERDLFARTLRELYHVERELEDRQTELTEAVTDEELEAFSRLTASARPTRSGGSSEFST
ncbi:hypothetical protein [Natronobacterium gregoryi]|uniref:Uncharacterized protein n=2 Tax=Natronobacterium gregoryi TaxID=44930 RepID=L0AEP4_NATGS|nr:hypothetical protein [Natronobacterium gregoryi]AFZ71904.1 hypothetical protein Natgr_0656 [Natronobacterium gregoryi SP2]ELY62475.1 hypothetical protein C490_17973 [Natronobacterium gregoryi SP2]PLK20688.1 hypothetical protein CYV19_07990 [Natronobacterium gregoryi SP2]SFJ14335.1 hypothetical protein SAMN05443661_11564 [Natronobacterium gregoryi]